MDDGDWLHNLVRSLSDREFRFIKDTLDSGRKKPTQKELLLQDLRYHASYEPTLLKPKYRNFEVLRFQLKLALLKALRQLHEGIGAEQKILVHLQNEQILYQKGIHEQSQKELQNALGLALQHHLSHFVVEILRIKVVRLMETTSRDLFGEISRTFEQLNHYLGNYYRDLDSFREYQELFARYRTEEGAESYRQPNHADGSLLDLPFFSGLYRNATQIIQAKLDGDLSLALKLSEQCVQWFDQYPTLREEHRLRYKIALANWGVLLIVEKRFIEVGEIISKLKKLDSKDFNEEAETFQNVVHLELLLMVNTLDFVGQGNLIRRVETGLVQYAPKVNTARKLTIWYNTMVLYMINENFSEAHKMVNQIIAHKRFQVRKEIQYVTRLFELVICFELQLWDLPDHLINAVQRYLERKEQTTDYKIRVLRYLKKLIDTPIHERELVIHDLCNTLDQILMQKTEYSPGLGVATGWAHSKLEKCTIKSWLIEWKK